MKVLLLPVILLSYFFMPVSSPAQTVKVDGYVRLDGQTNHNGVSVEFHRLAPSESRDTVITNDTGYYTKSIPAGIYEILFSKKAYSSKTMKNVILYSDKTIDSVILYSGFLSGYISGTLEKGNYIVEDSIVVKSADTLVLKPGTKLLFKKDASMTVYGYLDARGTEQDSIYFTRYLAEDDNPDSVYWKGIRFHYSSYGQQDNIYNSTLKYCHVSFCNNYGFNIDTKNPIIENSLIRDCENGILVNYSFGKIRNIKIENCYSRDTSIYANQYSCLYLVNPLGIVIIENIEITGIKNKYTTAVGFFADSNWKLSNFFIHDNFGPVISMYNGSATFCNSTIVSNKAFGGYGYSGHIIFVNCIIADNHEGGFNCSLYNSAFYNNGQNDSLKKKWIGINVKTNRNGDSCDAYDNIILDPKFLDPANQDYRLAAGSPCIDAGNNDSVRTAEDFLLNKRIRDGNNDGTAYVDMGAYEFSDPSGIEEYPKQEIKAGIYPNPASEYIMLPESHSSPTLSVSIYNSLGENVFALDNIGNVNSKIDVSNLPVGMYFVVWQTQKGFESEKVVVRR